MLKIKEFLRNGNPLYLISVGFTASLGISLFLYSFPKWNVLLYFCSMAILAVCFGLAVFPAAVKAGKKRPAITALISGAVFLAVAFAAVFFVNNVILHAQKSTLAALIMAAVFAVCFIAELICVSVKSEGSRAKSVIFPVAIILLLLAPARAGLKNVLPVKYDFPFESKITETKGLDNVSKDNRLIINADDSHWWGFWNGLAESGRFDEESLNEYVMNYADSGVTDLLFNIFGQSSDVPTNVLTFRGDLYGKKTQNGNPVDYSSYYGLNAFYNEQDIDIFAVWIEKCREVGIKPWISIRMNDCHDPDETTSQLRGELFYTARENGWMIGEEYGYFRNCFNYAVPEIRELMLDYTKEQLMKYDVYGLELDFMREIYCFDYINADNGEIVGIMNDYMRQSAEIVKEAEKKWGHDIELSVRMPRDLDQCKAFGFDVLAWINEKLIDSVTVTPRFSSNDSAMPIADWKERCGETEIYAGIETLVNTQSKGCCASAEVVRGYGAQYLTAGADGLYLFNYMTSPPGVGAREREVYDTCGSLEEILKHSRRHIVTYQDTTPEGYEPYDPLPLKIAAGKTASLEIETGFIPESAKVSFYIGFNKEINPSDISLTVNGKSCSGAEKSEVFGRGESGGTDVPQGYCRTDCFIYRFDLTDISDLPNLLSLTFENAGDIKNTVTYAEADVII
ncbi:MAG: hypothetical protein IJS90_07980 [Clostridia bacterium]|nr:hypothetical protein [Clostridia bacterium]